VILVAGAVLFVAFIGWLLYAGMSVEDSALKKNSEEE